MSNRRPWLNIFLIVSFVLVIIIVIGYVALSNIWSGRVQDELAKIKANGEPITCAELAPDPIPDDENAALVYERVFIMMPDSDTKIITEFVKKGKRAADPSLWYKSQQALARNQSLLDMIAEAAEYPACQFPVNWEEGPEAIFSHFSDIRDVAYWQAADALVKAKNGDMSGAVNAIVIGLKASESVKDEPTLISLLVSVATQKVLLDSLRDSLKFGSISESEVRLLDSTLSKIKLNEQLVNALIGERAQGLWIYNEMAKKPEAWESFGVDVKFDITNLPLYLSARKIGRPILNADQAYYLRFMNKQIELSKQPYYKVADKLADFDPEKDAPAFAPIAKNICPVFTRAGESSETGMARIAVTRAGLGAIAYKGRYGVYPSSLAEIKSKLDWELSKDPFSGKDLKYKRAADGFIVYSIGANMADDGGKAPDSKSSNLRTGDVVWKFGK